MPSYQRWYQRWYRNLSETSTIASIPSPFRFNADTPRKKFRSGAYSNQMKQVKMILKAQEDHFQLHNSTQHRYGVDMTNDRHQDGTPKVGCPGHPYYLCGHRSSCQLRICAVLSCGVQSAPPELSESSLLASFGSDERLNYPKPYV